MQGDFNLKKVPLLALEIMEITNIGNAFQARVRDIHGHHIYATLHPNCIEVVRKQLRTGRIIILKDVA